MLFERGEDYSSEDEIRAKYLDSVHAEMANFRNDSLTRYYYRKLTVDYYDLNQYDKSLSISKKVYDLGLKAKDTLSMAKGMHFSGVSYYGKENNDSAFYYYAQAEKLYSTLNDARTLGEVVLYKAYIYYNIGEYVLCEEEAFRALDLLEEENRPTDIYNCYNLIANSLDGQNDNEEAIRFYGLALDQLDNFKSEGYSEAYINLTKASCFNNMGGVYVKMGRHQKAISIYRQAMEFDGVKNNPSLYSKLLNNLAYARFKSGNTAELPDMFYKSLKIRDSLGNDSGIITSHINLGEYYVYHKDTSKAIQFIKEAYRLGEEKKSHSDILKSLKMLALIDKKNSIAYSNRYIALNDSLQEISEATRNKFARIEYETDRLEDEKEALAKKNSFILGVSVVVLLFVAAIFVIYYLNSRNKELLLIQEQQKANEEIYQLMFEQQNNIESARTEEKTRIAMELHDGILNNIYAVRLNLEFINKKTDEESIQRRKEYIKELQTVETEIRGVSHDLSRNALFNQEQSFENMLKFMITSQKNNFDTDFEAEIDGNIDWENMSNVCKVNMYRIIQETLQNINKYSEAKHAKVNVAVQDGAVAIRVTDDGVGFDPEKAKGGIGLKNLRKRADALNGTLEIKSQPGKGATVEVVFPV
jgi:signal transduction histidine kinase